MLVSAMLTTVHNSKDKVIVVSPELSVKACADLMKKKNVGAFPVISDGKLVGIVSERDIVFRNVAEGHSPLSTKVRHIMTTKPYTVTPTTDLFECEELMKQKGIRHLPVIDGKFLVGIISQRDVLFCLNQEFKTLNDHLKGYITSSH